MPKLILASKSPRRRELLEKQNIDFISFVPDVDEKSVNEDDPYELVKKISLLKARKAAEEYGDSVPVLASDTVVAISGRVLGKPKNEDEAREMLLTLSGKKHVVYTGITIIYNGKTVSKTVPTDVYFKTLSLNVIDDYIKSGEPMDKAGAYGVQQGGARFVTKINGDFFAVMGLPVCELFSTLEKDFNLYIEDLRK